MTTGLTISLLLLLPIKSDTVFITKYFPFHDKNALLLHSSLHLGLLNHLQLPLVILFPLIWENENRKRNYWQAPTDGSLQTAPVLLRCPAVTLQPFSYSCGTALGRGTRHCRTTELLISPSNIVKLNVINKTLSFSVPFLNTVGQTPSLVFARKALK